MMVRKPEDGDPAVAARIREAATAYTVSARQAATSKQAIRFRGSFHSDGAYTATKWGNWSMDAEVRLMMRPGEAIIEGSG